MGLPTPRRRAGASPGCVKNCGLKFCSDTYTWRGNTQKAGQSRTCRALGIWPPLNNEQAGGTGLFRRVCSRGAAPGERHMHGLAAEKAAATKMFVPQTTRGRSTPRRRGLSVTNVNQCWTLTVTIPLFWTRDGPERYEDAGPSRGRAGNVSARSRDGRRT